MLKVGIKSMMVVKALKVDYHATNNIKILRVSKNFIAIGNDFQL
ncbi:hypothetical protein ACQKOF_06865 [Lysinibacillus sp. NPDC093190]